MGARCFAAQRDEIFFLNFLTATVGWCVGIKVIDNKVGSANGALVQYYGMEIALL